jgi:predicted nucleotidyltransferase
MGTQTAIAEAIGQRGAHYVLAVKDNQPRLAASIHRVARRRRFRIQSDLDILVDPTPETSIFDIGEIRYQLRNLLGVSVDVLTPKALHVRLRDRILSEASRYECSKALVRVAEFSQSHS